MSTAEPAPVTDAELGSLFSGLERFPALVLAVSGGPDSTALMLLAARWRAARKAAAQAAPKLVVVTVDHGLRAEAQAEAAAVARLARKLGLAHRTLRWTGRKPKTGLQQAARAARYRLLAEEARAAGAGAVLTAHTCDDQAETLLIRMSRGSGIAGLAGMHREAPLPIPRGVPASQKGGKGAELLVIRPLLDIPKARLVATLKAAKVPFAEDPSNRDPRFTRARLRALMPELAKESLDAPRLALLARRLQRANAAIEAAVDRAAAELAVNSSGPAALAYDEAGFARLPAEIGLRLLGRAIDQVGDEGPVELAKLEALKQALDRAQAGHARFRRSLAGAIVTLKSPRIVVERAPPRRGRPLTTGRRGKTDCAKTR